MKSQAPRDLDSPVNNPEEAGLGLLLVGVFGFVFLAVVFSLAVWGWMR
jgi:hypothetical protein